MPITPSLPVQAGCDFRKVQRCAGIVIIARQRLGSLKLVSLFCASGVVGQHSSSGKKLMINLRHRHHETVAGQQRRRAPDGRGDLENFREQHQSRIFARRDWPQNLRAHQSILRRQINVLGLDDHKRSTKQTLRLRERFVELGGVFAAATRVVRLAAAFAADDGRDGLDDFTRLNFHGVFR